MTIQNQSIHFVYKTKALFTWSGGPRYSGLVSFVFTLWGTQTGKRNLQRVEFPHMTIQNQSIHFVYKTKALFTWSGGPRYSGLVSFVFTLWGTQTGKRNLPH